ncbi:MAG: hypothetical protein ACRDT9_03980 [Agromyces sp.]
MGRRSVTTPASGFALQLGEYLWHLVEADGGDRTGRHLSRVLNGERARDYCGKLLDGSSAMNTNDIALIADWLEISPYEFIRQAREWAPATVTPIRRNVGAGTEHVDLHSVEIPDDVAASTDNTTPDPDRGQA